MIAQPNPIRDADAVHGVNVVHLSDGTLIHLDDIATVEDGQGVLDDLDAAIDRIEAQIASRRAEIDPDWLRRANTALRRKRRMRPRLQQRIGELRRAERRAAPLPPTKVRQTPAADMRRVAFINAAEAMLDRELFVEIWHRAAESEPTAFEGWRSVEA